MAMTQYGMPPAYCPERAYHTSPAAYALGGNGYTAPMVRAQSQPLDRVVSTTTADNLEQAAVSAVPAEMDWSAPTWEEQMGMRGFVSSSLLAAPRSSLDLYGSRKAARVALEHA